MLEMSKYIRAAFKEDILDNLNWMDEETKARARLKLDNMVNSLYLLKEKPTAVRLFSFFYKKI